MAVSTTRPCGKGCCAARQEVFVPPAVPGLRHIYRMTQSMGVLQNRRSFASLRMTMLRRGWQCREGEDDVEKGTTMSRRGWQCREGRVPGSRDCRDPEFS